MISPRVRNGWGENGGSVWRKWRAEKIDYDDEVGNGAKRQRRPRVDD
jgi:hypothetical protein